MTTEEQSKKIFLIEEVEDEPSLRNALRDKLAREGFNVIEAKSGEEGLALALREHPDLILLDILMPGVDGLSMLKSLRESSDWGKNVPVIFLSNLSPNDEKINQVIAECEPAYYLVKSNWSIGDIVGKIKERLNRSY